MNIKNEINTIHFSFEYLDLMSNTYGIGTHYRDDKEALEKLMKDANKNAQINITDQY